jgi:hypothetical protein
MVQTDWSTIRFVTSVFPGVWTFGCDARDRRDAVEINWACSTLHEQAVQPFPCRATLPARACFSIASHSLIAGVASQLTAMRSRLCLCFQGALKSPQDPVTTRCKRGKVGAPMTQHSAFPDGSSPLFLSPVENRYRQRRRPVT